MRKTILTVFLLLVFHLTEAGTVPAAQALKMAESFLGGRVSMVSDSGLSRKVAARSQDNPGYYIIQADGGAGWVIMAADDRINPILAYSEKGVFSVSAMSDNMRLWMDDLKVGIAGILDSSQVAEQQVAARWNALESGGIKTRSGVTGSKVLTTAEWGQNSPFNSFSPIMPGESDRSPVGCVATAMGIVMQYYKWPASGSGVIGGYYTSDLGVYIPPYSISGTTYSWRDMPRGNKNEMDSVQARSIARLLHDCAVMAKTDFSCRGSSASLSSACVAMTENMSYSRSVRLVSRSAETAASWFDSIAAEIEANRVVMIGATGNRGGHAMVCDGYDSNGRMLHINWGWDGINNGFYTLDLSVTGYSAFNIAQTAAVSLFPYWMGDDEPADRCRFVSCYSQGCDALKINSPYPLEKGSVAEFSIGNIRTTSLKLESVSVKLVLEDSCGNQRQVLCARKGVPVDPDEYVSFSETCRLDVEPGLEDRIVLYAKTHDGEWEKVHADFHSYPDFEYVSCGTTPLPFVEVDGTPEEGRQISLSIAGGYCPWSGVKWQIGDSNLEGNVFAMPAGTVKISALVSYPDGNVVKISRNLSCIQ